jgi:hypothetical protein
MKYYGSGLIGLDMKNQKRVRVRKNSYRTPPMRSFIISAAVAASILGLLLLAGAR